MAFYRSKIRWTIPGAGTAYTVLHWGDIDFDGAPSQADADTIATKLGTFVTAMKPFLPNSCSLQVQNEIESISQSSGEMQEVFSTAATVNEAGTGGASLTWAAAVGAVITWNTPGVRNSRRVRGRTFLVPLVSNCFSTDGTLDTTKLASLNTLATDLRTPTGAVQLAIFARPTAPGATDGDVFAVTGHRIPDMGAILTSRRS